MAASPIRIFIADDHQLVIDGIKLMFSTEEDLTCVGEASNGQQVLDSLSKVATDVLLLDIEMPVLNGLDTCKQMRIQYPEVKIIHPFLFSQET